MTDSCFLERKYACVAFSRHSVIALSAASTMIDLRQLSPLRLLAHALLISSASLNLAATTVALSHIATASTILILVGASFFLLASCSSLAGPVLYFCGAPMSSARNAAKVALLAAMIGVLFALAAEIVAMARAPSTEVIFNLIAVSLILLAVALFAAFGLFSYLAEQRGQTLPWMPPLNH